jgi:hypothetical protein
MKITKITRMSNEYGYEMESCLTTLIETQKGKLSASFGNGEPEDMTLGRDLSDAYSIEDMLVMAYEAGKSGEELEIDSITENEQ